MVSKQFTQRQGAASTYLSARSTGQVAQKAGICPPAKPVGELGHADAELRPWLSARALPRGYGNAVPAHEREAWDGADFVQAYNDRCEVRGLPPFDGNAEHLAYLASYTYPTSGCPTLASFAEQRIECDLFNG